MRSLLKSFPFTFRLSTEISKSNQRWDQSFQPDESSGVLTAEAEVAEEQRLAGVRFDVLAGLGTESFVELELDDEADKVPESSVRMM